ncbi:hypothetical protein CBL_20164 [Carabus blaptoides fortunei]
MLPVLVKRQLAINNLVQMMELEEDEAHEEMIISHLKKRKNTHVMFDCRETEETFSTLFQNYLMKDDKFFQRYLRLPKEMFFSLLKVIQCDLKVQPTNRHKDPISPAHQLCLTLRLVYKRPA